MEDTLNTIDMITTQKNMEELFNRNQLMDVLRDQFRPLTDDPFKLDCVVQIYLHKQADVPTMVGLFSPKWGEPQDVADMLIEVVEEDLIDYDMETMRFIMKYEVTKNVQDLLDKYQFPLPMIVRPNTVSNNHMGSGYYDKKGRIILNGSDVFDNEDVCLDHINRVNSVSLSLNTNVVASEQGMMILPRRKTGESFIAFQKRQKQAQTFYETSLEVMEGLLVLGNEFWLTNKYDRRGRTYAIGYHVSTQGDDYRKAVLELSRKEIITG